MSERAARLKFRKDLTMTRHTDFGGNDYIVVHDPLAARFFKISVYERQFLETLDGSRTLQQAVEALREQGRYYPLEDAGRIAEKAANAGLLLGSAHSPAAGMIQKKRSQSPRGLKALSSIYFVYIPLVNPDRFLDKTVWIFRSLINRFTMGLALSLSLGALYIVLTSLPRITNNYTYFFNMSNLLVLWFVIVIVKLIHELAHAYTAKGFGLSVPGMGLAFLVFTPCLYCDTTDAWRLAQPGRRILISLAGIISEALVATFATYIWFFTKPGLLNSAAFHMMLVSLVSTILINGNPLIKLDGYFALMDWLRIPNLYFRSSNYLKYLIMNQALGIENINDPSSDRREAFIFGIYGALKTLYRFFLFSAIIGAVYFKFDKFLGAALAGIAILLFIILPLTKAIITVYRARKAMRLKWKVALGASVFCAAGFIALVVPWWGGASYPCYLEASRIMKITAPLDGAVRKVWIKEGQIVEAGAPMFTLEPVAVELALAKKIIERKILESELNLLKLNQQGHAGVPMKEMELAKVRAEERKLRGDIGTATGGACARFRGIITELDKKAQPGYDPGKGTVIGELKSLKNPVVVALTPERDIQRIKPGQSVSISFKAFQDKTYIGVVEKVRKFSERDLRGSVFSSERGGPIATEKIGEDGAEKPLNSHYLCYTTLKGGDGPPLGATGHYTIDSPPRSLLRRLFDSATQIFNRESLI
jgi:putative peptide zinc metalloprotease protein